MDLHLIPLFCTLKTNVMIREVSTIPLLVKLGYRRKELVNRKYSNWRINSRPKDAPINIINAGDAKG